jgi:two-component system chemotaxis response regulator CheB
MKSARVLLVDDSSVTRRVIGAALSEHPEIEVVASLPNGELALARLPDVQPDVVILDVEMPGMDGVETLLKLRQAHPSLPVIMFSALTERGAEVTVRALAAGASDYVCKPSATAGRSAESVISQELIPKILALCGRPSLRSPTIKPPASNERRTRRRQAELVVIASSTGGPNALAELLPLLPPSLPVPVLIVQHMPPVFTRYLAERFNAVGPLRAREASEGDPLVPGQILVAPGDYHLEIHRDAQGSRATLNQGPPENSCRPAADVLFRSAAAGYGASVLAVVLTGMGQDGLVGARAVVEAGGQVLVQNGPSCVVWGMPKAVEQAGLADRVLPLSELAGEITARCAKQEEPARRAAP